MSPADATAAAAATRWICVICGFVYDEALGLPEEGIAPATRWCDVPDAWGCPDCGATKAEFDMVPMN
ncbi:MAG TPA: rubredoxin [Ramlibacter sp.]|nr:rubredoxin [Ramlibacter sp.]